MEVIILTKKSYYSNILSKVCPSLLVNYCTEEDRLLCMRILYKTLLGLLQECSKGTTLSYLLTNFNKSNGNVPKYLIEHLDEIETWGSDSVEDITVVSKTRLHTYVSCVEDLLQELIK